MLRGSGYWRGYHDGADGFPYDGQGEAGYADGYRDGQFDSDEGED